MSAASIWQTLGIERTHDRAEIRRAYARRLKLGNPEDDEAAFKLLRAAYEQALAYAARAGAGGSPAAGQTAGSPSGTGDRAQRTPRPRLEPVSEPPRDPPPDRRPVSAHALACQRLETLVKSPHAGNPDATDPAALIDALKAVLFARELDDVGTQTRIERWLIQLLAANSPASDPLLAPTIDYFGWTEKDISRRDSAVIRTLLHRREDVRFLSGIAQPRSPHRRALRILKAPPIRPTTRDRLLAPRRAREVGALLKVLQTQHLTALKDLNAESVRFWTQYLAQPALSAWALWAVVLSPVALGVMLASAWLVQPDLAPLGYLLLVVPAFAVASIVEIHGITRPRRLWRERWAGAAPAWLRLGWAPAIVLLLLASSVIPASLSSLAIIVILAIVTAFWALITGEPDRQPGRLSWGARGLLSEAWLVIWWGSLVPRNYPLLYVQMTVALAAGVVASSFCLVPLQQGWMRGLSGWARLFVLLGLSALGFETAVLACSPPEDPLLISLAIASVAALCFAQRVVLPSLGPAALSARYSIMYVLAFAAVPSIYGASALARVRIGAAWLLGGLALTLFLALFAQVRDLFRRRSIKPGR